MMENPQKSDRKYVVLLVIIVILILVAIIGGSTFWVIHQIKTPLDPYGSMTTFTVEKGENVIEIGKSLEKDGIMSNWIYFAIYTWFKRGASSLQAGEYELGPQMNIPEIVEKITHGEIKSPEKRITIIEGWTNKEIAQYLEKEGLVKADEFLGLVDNPNSNRAIEQYSNREYNFLEDKPEDASLQGYLFPDTYRVYRDASTQDIVKKMLDNFGQKLDQDLRTEIVSQKKTIFEIVTMASLLEKEAKTYEDKRIIAEIFYKRIKANLSLQSCASVEYVLGTKKRILSIQDTKVESPYNTYLYKGLPPSSICNPGLDSIKAAIYSKTTPYWYFLSTKDDGTIIYGKTAEEHSLNKVKHLSVD